MFHTAAGVTVEAEILALLDGLLGALTQRRDADAAIALYAQDDDVMFWGSTEDEIVYGPEAVAELLREITGPPTRISSAWAAGR